MDSGAKFCEGHFSFRVRSPEKLPASSLKWSGKTGQSAKVYPTLENGYANDDETPIFR